MPHEISDADLVVAAQPYTPLFKVHPDDNLFNFLVNLHGAPGLAEYFASGRRGVQEIREVMLRWWGDKPARILEFAAGHGRLSRFHLEAFAGHDYVASDIHANACEFIASEFGVQVIQSHENPDDLVLDGGFDFIFVISLFSHLPDISFAKWLQVLHDSLRPGGVMMFTTHGEYAADASPDFFKSVMQGKNWGYRPESDQPDLDSVTYGSMVVAPSYVLNIIDRIGARLLSFKSGSWGHLQDEWVIRKAEAAAE